MSRQKAAKRRNGKTAPRLTLSAPLLKLDLGCGQNPKDGFRGADLHATGPTIDRVDLFRFPFPWATNSVEEIHCSHFLEHIEARTLTVDDLVAPEQIDFVGRDMLFAFFDECWRILVPGGTMQIVVPATPGNRAFQDPTHRRFIVGETFLYLHAAWRKANGLDHYRVLCDFNVDVRPTVMQEFSARSPEVQGNKLRHEINHAIDFHATLIANKPEAVKT